MLGIEFRESPAVPLSAPNRMDIACFVGLVAERGGGNRWLQRAVPCDSWDQFDARFAWDQTPVSGGGVAACYLGAAVRSYFRQGGHRCYVVRCGDSPPLGVPAPNREALLAELIPGYPQRLAVSALDRETWRGAGAMLGLEDASFLCVPDLTHLFGAVPEVRPPLPEPPPAAERFVECVPGKAEEKSARVRVALQANRYDDYTEWRRTVSMVERLLAVYRTDAQLIVSIPLAAAGSAVEREPDLALSPGGRSRYLQLAYPWLLTEVSGDLPGGIEPPEGVLAGLLARNALERGTYRPAARLPLSGVITTQPVYGGSQLESDGGRLLRRVSLFAPQPGGVALLSDVTTDAEEAHRIASVQRLVAVLLRKARTVGEENVFENNSERVWRRVRAAMESLLASLHGKGALRGATAEEAYTVVCDQSTMSRNDLDNGRLIIQVGFLPSAPVERIVVTLTAGSAGRAAA